MTKSLPPKSLVLYADDDLDDIELVRDAFEEYAQGIQLLTFKDGSELLRFVKELKDFEPLPCLIILDINMPNMDGKQTLSALRRMDRYEAVPIVLFSTSTLPSEAAFAKSFGAGFVTKPLHTVQINQLVDQMIHHCTDDVKSFFKSRKGK
jgi:CheY-like chemotaxis protein